ncbi:iduronate 2-sulfatase [Anticarsia gemmatalis]|uniref:iduronate 2-sulfatase n=1 Tax=Anticarsia gemmatalis TaxID=129554 RepID=UPI003F757EB0
MGCLQYFVCIILCLLYYCPQECRSVTKPNIIFILVDDLRHLSDGTINLPNIQKLADEGVEFKNAFAQQALCAPSRNSMLTGRRPDSLRLYDFYNYWRDTAGNFTTLPQFFKENGYDTYSVGKIFHPGISSNFTDDYPYSWSEYPYHPPSEIYKDAAVCKDKFTRKLQSNLICPVNVMHQPSGTLPDIESLEAAVDILSRNNSKPFLLAVGFHKPHVPIKFPKEYLEQIPLNKVKPQRHPYMSHNTPTVAFHPWTDVRHRDDIARLNIPFPWGTMPYDWSLKIRQSYYAATMYVDDLIGQLMSWVDRRKTIVVLTSDHGWSLGENGLWAKYSNFDVALKVPLIISLPGQEPKSIHTPVELLDIFPTLVDYSGLAHNITNCQNSMDKSPLCFEGKSLKPLITDETKSVGNYFAVSQYPRPSVYPQYNSDKPRLKHIRIMGYSIRTKRYRYTEWISFNNTLFTIDWNKCYGVELYDHLTDRDESNNLYLVDKYKNIKQYLSRLLRSHVNRNYN